MTSFAPILNGLGLKCQFIEDPIGTERLKSRVPPRNASYVRTMPAATGILFTARMLKRIRRLGGMARMPAPSLEYESGEAEAEPVDRGEPAGDICREAACIGACGCGATSETLRDIEQGET